MWLGTNSQFKTPKIIFNFKKVFSDVCSRPGYEPVFSVVGTRLGISVSPSASPSTGGPGPWAVPDTDDYPRPVRYAENAFRSVVGGSPGYDNGEPAHARARRASQYDTVSCSCKEYIHFRVAVPFCGGVRYRLPAIGQLQEISHLPAELRADPLWHT